MYAIRSYYEDLAPPEKQNIWLADAFVEFTPAIQGKFKWVSSRRLLFSPDYPLEPIQSYEARITSYNVCYTKLLRLLLLCLIVLPLRAQDDDDAAAEGGKKKELNSTMLSGLKFRSIGPALRITSYNVCYTKLLRKIRELYPCRY